MQEPERPRDSAGSPPASGSAGKRHLPVLKASAPASEATPDERPAWHWIVIGGVATLLAWLPLMWLGGKLELWILQGTFGDPSATTETQARDIAYALSSSQKWWLYALTVAVPVVTLTLAGVAGGVLVGRFGGAAGRKEALLAAAAAAPLPCIAGARSSIELNGVLIWLAITLAATALAALAGRIGGGIGLRLRVRAKPG